MKERALLFGESKALVGVVAEPATPAPADHPGVVFLNAGVLHRVGPNRVHVRLARELARAGFASVRFDLSGLGDSRARPDPVPFAQSVVTDTRQAMDVLASRGVRSFLLVGICSGADNALRVAAEEPRVVGAALIEPYSAPAPGFVLYAYRSKLLDPRAWWRLLRGRSEAASLVGRSPTSPVAGVPELATPAEVTPEEAEALVPSGEELVRRVRGLLDRGTRLCFVYSSESPAYFNYLSLLRREMRRPIAAGSASVLVVKRTDHSFTPRPAQDSLVAAVRAFAGSFPERSGRPLA